MNTKRVGPLKKAGVCLLLILAAVFYPLSGQEKLTRNSELGIQYYFKANQNRNLKYFYAEPFETGILFQLDSKPMDNLKFRAVLDANLDFIDVDELWMRYKGPSFSLKIGTFENGILFDDFIPSWNSLFSTKNQVYQRLKYMGWYTKNATGIELSTGDLEDTRLLEGSAHVFINYSDHEINGTFNLYWPYAGKDSFLGVGGALFPYEYVKKYMTWNTSYARDFYGVYTLYWGDWSSDNRFVYKVELTLGNNKFDSVGNVSFPGEESWLGGFDFQLGVPVRFSSLTWTPGIDLSYLIYDMGQTDAFGTEFRLGNRIAFDNTLFLHLDWGRRFISYYERNDLGDLEARSRWEGLWALSFQLCY